MTRIMVVDDEPNIIELAKLYLEREGYQVAGVENGEEAIAQQAKWNPDLIVLDIMLPDIDGFEVCRRIRTKSKVPILILTARTEDTDKIVGLEMGADDYLTKPYNPRELVARVKAILRRSQSGPATGDSLDIGRIHIDLARHEVAIDGQPVKLRTKEFSLLATFAQNQGIVLSREKLLEMVWGFDYFGESRTVDVHINHLREKIAGSGVQIETLRGTGYKMTVSGGDQ